MAPVTQELVVRVHGTPVAWARAGRQVRTRGGKAFVHTFTPSRVQEWEDNIALFAQKAAASCGWVRPERDTPLRVDVDYHFPRGSARKRDVWKVSKPDKDNLDKAVLDALVWSGVIVCDQQVVDGRTRKLIDDDWQGALIRITPADSPVIPAGHPPHAMPADQEAMAL